MSRRALHHPLIFLLFASSLQPTLAGKIARRLEGSYVRTVQRDEPFLDKYPHLLRVLPKEQFRTLPPEINTVSPVKYQSLHEIQSSPITIRRISVTQSKGLPQETAKKVTEDPDLFGKQPIEIPEALAKKYFEFFATTPRGQVRKPTSKPAPTTPPQPLIVHNDNNNHQRNNYQESSSPNLLRSLAEMFGMRQHPQIPSYPQLFSMGKSFDVGFQPDGRFRVGKNDGFNVMGMNFGTNDGINIGANGFGFGKTQQYGPVVLQSGPNLDINWGNAISGLMRGIGRLG